MWCICCHSQTFCFHCGGQSAPKQMTSEYTQHQTFSCPQPPISTSKWQIIAAVKLLAGTSWLYSHEGRPAPEHLRVLAKDVQQVSTKEEHSALHILLSIQCDIFEEWKGQFIGKRTDGWMDGRMNCWSSRKNAHRGVWACSIDKNSCTFL